MWLPSNYLKLVFQLWRCRTTNNQPQGNSRPWLPIVDMPPPLQVMWQCPRAALSFHRNPSRVSSLDEVDLVQASFVERKGNTKCFPNSHCPQHPSSCIVSNKQSDDDSIIVGVMNSLSILVYERNSLFFNGLRPWWSSRELDVLHYLQVCFPWLGWLTCWTSSYDNSYFSKRRSWQLFQLPFQLLILVISSKEIPQSAALDQNTHQYHAHGFYGNDNTYSCYVCSDPPSFSLATSKKDHP